MNITITESVLIRNGLDKAVSQVVPVRSDQSSVVAQLKGTGAISATVNIYGGIYSHTDGAWVIKVLDDSFNISGTDSVNLRKNTTTNSTHIQVEVVNLTGTNAKATVGLINSAVQ